MQDLLSSSGNEFQTVRTAVDDRTGGGDQAYQSLPHQPRYSFTQKPTLIISILLTHVQCESKKIPPPEVLWQFFQNCWEFFDQILLAY